MFLSYKDRSRMYIEFLESDLEEIKEKIGLCFWNPYVSRCLSCRY